MDKFSLTCLYKVWTNHPICTYEAHFSSNQAAPCCREAGVNIRASGQAVSQAPQVKASPWSALLINMNASDVVQTKITLCTLVMDVKCL